MDLSAIHLQPFFDWLVRTSWQASVLVCLILLVQKVLGRWIGVRGCHCLWLLLLIRLVLPWAPPSGLSVHNLVPIPLQRSAEIRSGREAHPISVGMRREPVDVFGAADSPGNGVRTDEAAGQLGAVDGRPTALVRVLLLGWLVGAGGLAGCMAAGSLRLRRIMRRGRPVTDRWVLGVLDECRRLMDTRAAVQLIATDKLPCPALCGVVRPRLLLPRDTLAERDRSELRHIFLHELAHLKRHDILVGYLAGLLHVLHWFNPLIVVGLRRMRADREMVCDGLVLSRLHPDETCAYGRTVVRQIERLLATGWRPILTGLCGDGARIKQRITMISLFRRDAYRGSWPAVMLVAVLACVGLTDGLGRDRDSGSGPSVATWDDYARSDLSTRHQDEHANIQRACVRHMETGKYLVVDGENVTCDADEPGEMGLWEVRFDEASNTAESVVYLYSVAARKYLASDQAGNLAANAADPTEAAHWGTFPRPQGVWLVSHYFEKGYLRRSDDGRVRAEFWGRDAASYWDVHAVWRIKTSDDPKANPQWQREHIPGPD